MKKGIMKKWVKALRSGEYLQDTGFLAQEDNGEHKFCCLGVLCNIMQEETGELNIKESYNFWDDTTDFSFNGMVGELPREVKDWSGMSSHKGFLPKSYKINDAEHSNLADLNDSGMSFKQIANIIEKNYEKL